MSDLPLVIASVALMVGSLISAVWMTAHRAEFEDRFRR